ncbi:MAG: hypothetical protein ACW99G_11600 [Candidatus Thorarchaeota archaeon]
MKKIVGTLNIDNIHDVSTYHETSDRVLTVIYVKVGEEDGQECFIRLELPSEVTPVLVSHMVGAVAKQIRYGSLEDTDHVELSSRKVFDELRQEHGEFRYGYSGV